MDAFSKVYPKKSQKEIYLKLLKLSSLMMVLLMNWQCLVKGKQLMNCGRFHGERGQLMEEINLEEAGNNTDKWKEVL